MLSGGQVRVMASAWSAPPWMKNNGQFVSGMLRWDMYQLWADYHVRFLEEYAARGVDVWALTTGNEPINAFVAPLLVRFNSMGWTPLGQRRWVSRHLGPTLRRSKYNATLLLALDDQRVLLPWWLDIVSSVVGEGKDRVKAFQLSPPLHSLDPLKQGYFPVYVTYFSGSLAVP